MSLEGFILAHSKTLEEVGDIYFPLMGLELVDGYTTKSATNGQCSVILLVTFPVAECCRCQAGAELCCLTKGRRTREHSVQIEWLREDRTSGS